MEKHIFINLKRFDVPQSYGGICPLDDPVQWIKWVIDESIVSGLGELDGIGITYILPEAIIITAVNQLALYKSSQTKNIRIGCQGVFREDVNPNGNFGAFTTNFPAAAAKNMGCSWAMIGHSEERKDKKQLMELCGCNPDKAGEVLNEVINQEVHRALEQKINLLLCIGETAEEKGTGSEESQHELVRQVLQKQILGGLNGINSYLDKVQFVIGYEPIWAIGPGKTPPNKEYIAFVSSYIKELLKEAFGTEMPVVYGGGLKESNASMISSINTIDGGLVALTMFTTPPAFEPQALKNIILAYK